MQYASFLSCSFAVVGVIFKVPSTYGDVNFTSKNKTPDSLSSSTLISLLSLVISFTLKDPLPINSDEFPSESRTSTFTLVSDCCKKTNVSSHFGFFPPPSSVSVYYFYSPMETITKGS